MEKSPETILSESGQMLFGPRFQTALGKSMGVDRRTIINWLSNAPAAEHPMWARLDGLMRARVFDIQSHRYDIDTVRRVA